MPIIPRFVSLKRSEERVKTKLCCSALILASLPGELAQDHQYMVQKYKIYGMEIEDVWNRNGWDRNELGGKSAMSAPRKRQL